MQCQMMSWSLEIDKDRWGLPLGTSTQHTSIQCCAQPTPRRVAHVLPAPHYACLRMAHKAGRLLHSAQGDGCRSKLVTPGGVTYKTRRKRVDT